MGRSAMQSRKMSSVLTAVAAAAVASVLLGGSRIANHARGGGRQGIVVSPIEDLSLGGLQPWVDPDSEAAAFITGSGSQSKQESPVFDLPHATHPGGRLLEFSCSGVFAGARRLV